jgi:adenine-specific DNA-methyltransferase
MTVQKLKPIFNLEQERIEMLKQLVPEAVSDGKINWDVLKEALGEYLETEGTEVEHFGLTWPGKREARRLASVASKGTLVPVPGEGIDEETTGNIFIEGDNLEVLKLLQKSYAGLVKMIYIDPPYNTGNDFLYNDDFKEPLDNYLKKTSQADEEGKLLTSNPKSGGRFHSNWLNMMYPRLKLARNLMSDDGIIAVTIDDDEVLQLGKLMDEVFGELNRLALAPWLSEASGGKEKTGLRTGHEYVLVYSKNTSSNISQEERTTGELNLQDQKGSYRKGRELMKWGGTSLRSDRPKQFYELPAPDGTKVLPYRNDGQEGHWRWGKENIKIKEALIDNTAFHWEKRPFDHGVEVNGNKERWVPYEKIRDTQKSIGWTTWLDNLGTNADATRELKVLFGFKPFDTPKPVSLLKWIINLHNDKNSITLDFFAGSCTTAHAVLDLNKEDGGKRKFIMVQLPEPCDEKSEAYKAGYQTISSIGKERIRRVIQCIEEELEGKLELTEKPHLGFKTYTLDRSNLKIWEDYTGNDVQAVQQSLLEFENRLVDGWTEERVITEVQLLEGFPLDSTIEQATKFTQNRVLCVTSEHIEHRLFICLDDKLDIATVQEVRLLEDEDIFICLDNALTDQEKIWLADGCNVKTI